MTNAHTRVYKLLGVDVNLTDMSDERLENERDQDIRMTCIDYATRVVGKPVFVENKKQHDDLIEVAKQIYKFVTSG